MRNTENLVQMLVLYRRYICWNVDVNPSKPRYTTMITTPSASCAAARGEHNDKLGGDGFKRILPETSRILPETSQLDIPRGGPARDCRGERRVHGVLHRAVVVKP